MLPASSHSAEAVKARRQRLIQMLNARARTPKGRPESVRILAPDVARALRKTAAESLRGSAE